MNFWTETMCEVGGFALGAAIIIGIVYFNIFPEKLDKIKKWWEQDVKSKTRT